MRTRMLGAHFNLYQWYKLSRAPRQNEGVISVLTWRFVADASPLQSTNFT